MDFKTSRASKKMGNTPYHTSAASQHRDKSCCESFDWNFYGNLADSQSDDTWYLSLISSNDYTWGDSGGTADYPEKTNYVSYSDFYTHTKLVGTDLALALRKNGTGGDTTFKVGITYFTPVANTEQDSDIADLGAADGSVGVYASSALTMYDSGKQTFYPSTHFEDFNGIVIPAKSFVMIGVMVGDLDGAVFFNGTMSFKKS